MWSLFLGGLLALEVVDFLRLDELAIDNGWVAKVTVCGAIAVLLSPLDVVNALLDGSVLKVK